MVRRLMSKLFCVDFGRTWQRSSRSMSLCTHGFGKQSFFAFVFFGQGLDRKLKLNFNMKLIDIGKPIVIL